MNLLYLCIAGLSIIAYFLIRGRWILWQIEAYKTNALWYCWKTKQGKNVAEEMSIIWPIAHILIEPWCWNFRRYVVSHEHFDDMTRFVVDEMAKEKLAADFIPSDEIDTEEPGEDMSNFPTAKQKEKIDEKNP